MDKRKYENKMFANTRDVELHGLKAKGTTEIKVDHEGTPVEKKWRRRLADGDIVLKEEETPQKKKGGKE